MSWLNSADLCTYEHWSFIEIECFGFWPLHSNYLNGLKYSQLCSCRLLKCQPLHQEHQVLIIILFGRFDSCFEGQTPKKILSSWLLTIMATSRSRCHPSPSDQLEAIILFISRINHCRHPSFSFSFLSAQDLLADAFWGLHVHSSDRRYLIWVMPFFAKTCRKHKVKHLCFLHRRRKVAPFFCLDNYFPNPAQKNRRTII